MQTKRIREQNYKEIDVQKQLITSLLDYPELKTEFEVSCKFGRVDVITYPLLIEIKEKRLYKHAIGQLKAYNKIFTHKKPLLYLYDPSGYRLKSKLKDKIFNLCRAENIWFFEHRFDDPSAFIKLLHKYNFIKEIKEKDLLKLETKYPQKAWCKVRNSEGKLLKIIK